MKSLLLLFLLCSLSLQSAILLVNPSASGPGARLSSVNLSDWSGALAFTNLQSALSFAQAGDSIWLKSSVYLPTQNVTNNSTGNSDRTNTFLIPSGVSVYGGFSGSETLFSSRNSTLFPATLSGDFSGNDVVSGSGSSLTFSNNTENAYHVVVMYDLTADVELDGLIITGGRADMNSNFLDIYYGYKNGAGVFVKNGASYLAIRDCIFRNNSCAVDITATGGGALYLNNSNPIINDCLFHANSARNGGALDCDLQSSPSLRRCIFSGNRGNVGGGAVYNLNSSNPFFFRCVFENNYSAAQAGVMFSETASAPNLTNCLLTGNVSVTRGGAIVGNTNSNTTLINCTLANNQCTGSTAQGGGLFMLASATGNVVNCILHKNSTPANTTDAGREEIYSLNTGAGKLGVSNSLVREAFPILNVNNNGANLSGDPLFVNESNPIGADNVWKSNDDGLALRPCSPAIDAGTSAGAPSVDLLNTARPTGAGYDLGAYEFVGSVPSYSILTSSLPDGIHYATYTESLSTDFPDNPTWTVSSGILPYGLAPVGQTIDGLVLSGGTFNFDLKASYGTCQVTKSFSIFVDGPLPIQEETSKGYSSPEVSEMSISPNPTSDHIYLNGKEGMYQAKLLNAAGATMMDSKGDLKLIEGELNEKILSLNSGVYWLKLEGTEIFEVRFIKY